MSLFFNGGFDVTMKAAARVRRRHSDSWQVDRLIYLFIFLVGLGGVGVGGTVWVVGLIPGTESNPGPDSAVHT